MSIKLQLQLTKLTNSEKLDIMIGNTSMENKEIIGNSIIQSRINKYKEKIDKTSIQDISNEIKNIIKSLYYKPIIMKKPSRGKTSN
jgi:hypothetical protein|tara:strand:- start:1723 stop:1980 length:258 start_codon:yes stop_codon:yes gene_type:complete